MRSPVDEPYRYGYKHGQWTFYGTRHKGVDHSVPKGRNVYAMFDGRTEVKVGFQGGKQIWLYSHDNRFRARSMHLSKMVVSFGQEVLAGDVIGLSGNTGALTTGAHLHQDLMIDGKWVDPLLYINNDDDMNKNEVIELCDKRYAKRDVRLNQDMKDGSVWVVNHGLKYKLSEKDIAYLGSLLKGEDLSDEERVYPTTKDIRKVLKI